MFKLRLALKRLMRREKEEKEKILRKFSNGLIDVQNIVCKGIASDLKRL